MSLNITGLHFFTTRLYNKLPNTSLQIFVQHGSCQHILVKHDFPKSSRNTIFQHARTSLQHICSTRFYSRSLYYASFKTSKRRTAPHTTHHAPHKHTNTPNTPDQPTFFLLTLAAHSTRLQSALWQMWEM